MWATRQIDPHENNNESNKHRESAKRGGRLDWSENELKKFSNRRRESILCAKIWLNGCK